MSDNSSTFSTAEKIFFKSIFLSPFATNGEAGSSN
jgi:hypothetical protein